MESTEIEKKKNGKTRDGIEVCRENRGENETGLDNLVEKAANEVEKAVDAVKSEA